MSKKRKSTLRAKVLTALLIILFAGSCAVIIFAICTGRLSRENNTNPTETTVAVETTSAPETTAQTEPAQLTSAASTTASETEASDIAVASAYDADYWVEYKADYGSSGLSVLFGANNTGASVSFDGNRFSVKILGSGTSSEIATGTFSFVSDTEIELRYDNSYIATATVLETENSVVTVMDFPLDTAETTLRVSVAQ